MVIPPGTTLQTSTLPWVDSSSNSIVIAKLPTVSGNVTATDIDPRGSIFKVNSDKNYRYFKGDSLPAYPYYAMPANMPGMGH